MTMDFKEMPMYHLEEMKNAIAAEIKRRNDEQKEIIWRKVREAIAEYLDVCGEIRVETWDTTYHLSNKAELNECGVIDMEEE